jgi:hypothetical protein
MHTIPRDQHLGQAALTGSPGWTDGLSTKHRCREQAVEGPDAASIVRRMQKKQRIDLRRMPPWIHPGRDQM